MQFITNAILREFGSFSKEITAKTKAILWIAAKTSWHKINIGLMCIKEKNSFYVKRKQ